MTTKQLLSPLGVAIHTHGQPQDACLLSITHRSGGSQCERDTVCTSDLSHFFSVPCLLPNFKALSRNACPRRPEGVRQGLFGKSWTAQPCRSLWSLVTNTRLYELVAHSVKAGKMMCWWRMWHMWVGSVVIAAFLSCQQCTEVEPREKQLETWCWSTVTSHSGSLRVPWPGWQVEKASTNQTTASCVFLVCSLSFLSQRELSSLEPPCPPHHFCCWWTNFILAIWGLSVSFVLSFILFWVHSHKIRVLYVSPFAFLSPGSDLLGGQEPHLFFRHHGRAVRVACHPLTLLVSPRVPYTSLGPGPQMKH